MTCAKCKDVNATAVRLEDGSTICPKCAEVVIGKAINLARAAADDLENVTGPSRTALRSTLVAFSDSLPGEEAKA